MSESASPTGPEQQPSQTPPQTPGVKPETPSTPSGDPAQGQPTDPTAPTGGTDPKQEPPKPCPEPKSGPTHKPYTHEEPKCAEIKIACDPPTTGKDPVAQLEELEAKLKEDKASALAAAQDAEKRKLLLADLTQRVASMQKTVGELKKTNDDYTEKYNKIYGEKRKVECWVAATRGQLDLPPAAQECVDAVVNKVEKRVWDAKDLLDCQQELIDAIEKKYKAATDEFTDAKKNYEFVKSGLLEGVGKKVDELSKLQPANPGKDSCLTYFYLNEMDALLVNEAVPPKGCADFDEPQIGTFVCCWPPDKYKAAYEAALVSFNNAEYVEKCLKTDLEAEKKKIPDLEKAWKEAKDKRRDWIVAALNDAKCCEKQPVAPSSPTASA